MNQAKLTRAISKRFYLTQVESGEIIKFIIGETTTTLKKEKRVCLHGLGSFRKEKRAAKRVRHPKTRKIITIPERLTVDFNPSSLLLKNLR